MYEINNNLQDNTEEEIVLNLKTETCYFLMSKLYKVQSSLKWKEYINALIDKKIIYYIDAENVMREADINYIQKRVTQEELYSIHFRVNYGQHFEWFTATVVSDKKCNNEIISVRISVVNHNLFNIQDLVANTEFLKEILFKGFGSMYSNLIWIDVNHDRYKLLNTFGNVYDVEQNETPVGEYVTDNKRYAANFVYKDDRNILLQYTSLEWYREHLKKEGDRFSFLIRHIYDNGEYRWVEAKTVCTERDDVNFHVLFWIEDVSDKVYNTAMKDTLASVKVGQWRLEIKNGCEEKFTISPSLMEILGIAESEDNDKFFAEIKKQIYYEDCDRVKGSIRDLVRGKEISFSFRLNNKNKGLRYYRCGVTCIAKNDIYTCYQGYGQDVTEIMQPMVTSVKEAEKIYFMDKLTGLYNRNYMESRCKNFIRKEELPVSFIMVDCDYLKRTNDTIGHEYGDLLLQCVAKSIQCCLSENSVAMRIGGDEFLVICAHCPNEEAGKIVAAIRQKLAENSDEVLKLGASLGIYTADDTSISFSDAYNMADRAMYIEKQQHHRSNLNI